MLATVCGGVVRAALAMALVAALAGGCGPEKFDRGAGLRGGTGGGGTGGPVADGGGGSAAEEDGGQTVSGDAGDDDGAAESDAAPRVIYFDFEDGLDGWLPVGGQRPPDVIDGVMPSADNQHHGASALAVVFDGHYTSPDPSAPFYGIYTSTMVPPPGAHVSMWMYTTAPGITVIPYVQLRPDYLFQQKTSKALPINQWVEVTVDIGDTALFYLGCLIMSPYTVQGTLYIDDIAW